MQIVLAIDRTLARVIEQTIACMVHVLPFDCLIAHSILFYSILFYSIQIKQRDDGRKFMRMRMNVLMKSLLVLGYSILLLSHLNQHKLLSLSHKQKIGNVTQLNQLNQLNQLKRKEQDTSLTASPFSLFASVCLIYYL